MLGGVDGDLSALLRLSSDAENFRALFVDQFTVVGILRRRRNLVLAAKFGHHLGAHIGTGDQIGASAGHKTGRMGIGQRRLGRADHLIVDKATHTATANHSSTVGFHYTFLRFARGRRDDWMTG